MVFQSKIKDATHGQCVHDHSGIQSPIVDLADRLVEQHGRHVEPEETERHAELASEEEDERTHDGVHFERNEVVVQTVAIIAPHNVEAVREICHAAHVAQEHADEHQHVLPDQQATALLVAHDQHAVADQRCQVEA